MDEVDDYRRSHLHKGDNYHRTFTEKPYRNMVWRSEKKILDKIVRDLGQSPSFEHLDFACGTGRILAHLKNYSNVSVGVDLSPSMLSVARSNNPDLEIIEADLTRNDVLEQRQFDLVTAFRFFPNAQPQLRKEAISVLRKHIKPSGLLVFNNHKNSGSARHRLLRLFGRNPHGMNREEVKDMLGHAGFEIQSIHALSIFPASESRTLLPLGLVQCLNKAATRIPILQLFGENIIYTCQKI